MYANWRVKTLFYFDVIFKRVGNRSDSQGVVLEDSPRLIRTYILYIYITDNLAENTAIYRKTPVNITLTSRAILQLILDIYSYIMLYK